MGKTGCSTRSCRSWRRHARAPRQRPLGRRSTVRPHRQRARTSDRADADGHDKQIAETILTGGETAELPDLGAALGRVSRTRRRAAGRDPGRPLRVGRPSVGRPRRAAHEARRHRTRAGRARVAARTGPVEAIALVGPSWVTRLRLAPSRTSGSPSCCRRCCPGRHLARARQQARNTSRTATPRSPRRSRSRSSTRASSSRPKASGHSSVTPTASRSRARSKSSSKPHRRIARWARPGAAGSVRHRQHLHADLIVATATNPETVPGALAELVGRRAVARAIGLRKTSSYGFKSPVVREVAYQSILHRRRPAYHRRVAGSARHAAERQRGARRAARAPLL